MIFSQSRNAIVRAVHFDELRDLSDKSGEIVCCRPAYVVPVCKPAGQYVVALFCSRPMIQRPR